MAQPLRAEARGTFERRQDARYCFEGPLRRDIAVQMYGMFNDASSIPNVCGQLAHTLRRAVPSLALQPYTGRPFFDSTLEALAGVDPHAPIGFFYGVPEVFGKTAIEHATRIIGLACETDRVPATWVACVSSFDLAIVPSRYCRESLRRSGVTVPILVVPHGLEPCYRPEREKRRSTPFLFYNVVNGQFPRRKGLPELLRAFRSAFRGRTDVRLRLRIGQGFAVRQAFADAGLSMDDPCLEILSPSNLARDEFAAAYSDVHCTVHPSLAEGFGLIPFQSIACETPVIAPRSTGLAEYIDETNAMVLRNDGVCEAPDVYYRTGTCPGIDEDHLVELLRHAEANWENEYARVRAVAADFRARHTWEKALAPFMCLIEELVTVPDPAARRALIRERVPA